MRLLLMLLGGVALWAQEPVRYTVQIPRPDSHYVEVRASLPTGGATAIDLKMAIWTQYVVREYARNVESISATAAGRAARVEKTAKNRWRVAANGAPRVEVSYRVYCHVLHVQDCYVDDEFALLNGAPLFLTLMDANRPHEVKFELPAAWRTSVTQMRSTGAHSYVAPDYDALVDSPVVLGNPVMADAEAAGKKITLVLAGPASQWDAQKAAEDLAKIATAQAGVWNGLPCERYYFLHVLAPNRGGGMEHSCSTATMGSPSTMRSASLYRNWLDLSSHEMFHLWNVKRLRPAEILPGEFEQEPYPKTLGIAEGFTSYYAPLMLYRARLSTDAQLAEDLGAIIHQLESIQGRRVQSLAMSSFDTWIKFYKPDENTQNTAISYYTKGAVVGFLLDARVRRMTSGRKKLDDVMQLALARNPNGYTLDSFRAAAEQVAGGDLTEFFRKTFESTEELDYSEALDWFGLERKPNEPQLYTGATIESRGNRMVITAVQRDSPADQAGLSADDELVTLNGEAASAFAWQDREKKLKPGVKAVFQIMRNGRSLTRTVVPDTRTSYTLQIRENSSAEQSAHRRAW
jgi:predicted metalloprotease with PDZ domain